jgi:hypothetical protein
VQSLYHYTTASAFESIVRNDCFWATRIEFLNDYTECALFEHYLEKKIFDEYLSDLRDIWPAIDNLDTVPDFLRSPHNIATIHSRTILENVRQTLDEHYPRYLLSFSNHEVDNNSEFLERNGQLSQWRGYGSVGGICLILDYTEFEKGCDKLLSENSVFLHFGDVKYVNSPSDIEAAFPPKGWEELPMAVDKYLHCGGTISIPPELHIAMLPFIKIAPFVKHIGFAEEREFRVVFSAISSAAATSANMQIRSNSGPNFRTKGDRLIPYLELHRGGLKSALRGVIVGPGSSMWHNSVSIRAMLRKYGLEIPVHTSNIPFE